MNPRTASHLDRSLAGLASRQHGLLSRAQAIAAGLGEGAIRHRVGTGRWRPLLPGVFVVAGAPPTWEQRVMAACLHAGPGTLAARRSAARLWRLPVARPADVHVLSTDGKRALPGVAFHRTTDLVPADATTCHGIPVTSVCRTIIDCAAEVHLHRIGEMLDDARRRGLVTLGDVARRVDELGRPGRNGIAAMRTALTDRDAPPASVFESRLARLLRDAGLPDPVRNHRLALRGQLYVLDFAFVAEQVCVEADSEAFHLDLTAFRRDRQRQNALVLAGWIVLRFTWADVRDRPTDVARQVAAAHSSVRATDRSLHDGSVARTAAAAAGQAGGGSSIG